MLKVFLCVCSLWLLFYQAESYAATPTVSAISEWTVTTYHQLTSDEQKTIAAQWHLTTEDYSHYLWLMQNTVSGIYYQDQHLDPSWILGFNAKSDQERDKYVLIAIKNERIRVARELAFQQAFDRLQREYYPHSKPIQTAKHT